MSNRETALRTTELTWLPGDRPGQARMRAAVGAGVGVASGAAVGLLALDAPTSEPSAAIRVFLPLLGPLVVLLLALPSLRRSVGAPGREVVGRILATSEPQWRVGPGVHREVTLAVRPVDGDAPFRCVVLTPTRFLDGVLHEGVWVFRQPEPGVGTLVPAPEPTAAAAQLRAQVETQPELAPDDAPVLPHRRGWLDLAAPRRCAEALVPFVVALAVGFAGVAALS